MYLGLKIISLYNHYTSFVGVVLVTKLLNQVMYNLSQVVNSFFN